MEVEVGAEQDRAYAALVRDLAALIMGVAQGTGATVCAVVRPAPELVWVSLAPRNQLMDRHALQLSLLGPAGRPRTYDDVLQILRRSESLRKHDRSRFDGLDIVGYLHGIAVRDSSSFLDDPSLAMFQDALRATVLTAAFRGSAPLPPAGTSRLAGFSWFSWDEPEWARLYVGTPAEPGVIGLDLDVPGSTELVGDLMAQLAHGIPAAWTSSEQDTPDDFCHRLFDLRSRERGEDGNDGQGCKRSIAGK